MTRNLEIELEKQRCFASLIALLLVVLLILFFAVKGVGQDSRPRQVEATNPQKTPAEPETLDVIKIDANLVSVPVIVSDREGRYIPNLPVTSFKLFDNGSEQQIVHFEAAEEPLNVALLLDTSRSTENVLDDIKKAAKDFLNELRPQDRALIISFDYDIHLLSGLTNDRKRLEKGIKEAKVGKYVGTVLNDAIRQVVEREFQSVTGRKAIVLLSDGEDHGSETPAELLLDQESESDTMVYSIYYKPLRMSGQFGGRFPRGGLGGIFGLPPNRPSGGRRRGRFGLRGSEFLQQLSETTSGRYYNSELTDFTKAFSLIAEELRHQYKLGFYPSEIKQDGSLHQLRVKVEGSDVAVRARRQYRAEK